MFLRRFIVILCLTILFSSCAQPQSQNSSKVSVVASFYPLAFLAQQIGGEHVSVHQITPAGVEPHDYEPSPRQLAAVHDAKVFLMNGMGLDPWADHFHDELKAKGVIVVRATDGIDLLPASADDHHEEDAETEHADEDEHEEGAYDPHVWLNPVLFKKEVDVVRDAFMHADPAHSDDYRRKADSLIAKLTALDTEYREGLKNCVLKAVITAHNAFRYLAKQYGFSPLAVAGMSPDEEPSPKKIADLADIAKQKSIKHIFFETLVSPKLAETLAQEVGAESLVLNPLEGLTPEDATRNEDYISIMRMNLRNLRTGMQCT